jgi:diphthine-ammonia ligase
MASASSATPWSGLRVPDYLASWSGGKDGCFACYLALAEGYKISHLVNCVAKEYQRVNFHGTEKRIVQLQSQAIGIPVFQPETTFGNYTEDFKNAIRTLLTGGIKGMVFGDIYNDQHLAWVEGVCAELGIEAVEPLWGKSTDDVINDFLDAGFEAVIVAADARLIGQEWLGKRVDRAFITYLKAKGIDPCGEGGEYHTVVVGGPLFQRKIEITESRTIKRDSYWFLDTVKYHIV